MGRGSLKRALGLPTLLFYGVGVIVGAGIYSILGAVAGEAGHAAWLSLALASVPAALTALCYAELCTRFPRAGGGYAYVKAVVPRWPAAPFIIGIVTLVTAAATAATVSLAFGGYLSMFAPVPAWASALGLVGACTLVSIAGIRQSSWVTIGCTLIEIAGLLIIIGAGATSGRLGEGAIEVRAGGVMAAAAIGFFVFTGFEGLANLAEETRKPERHLPLAMLVSLAVTLVLYVLTALAAVALLDPQRLAQSDSPLADAAAQANPRLATALGWVALFSTANTALITLVVAARLAFAMGREGTLPGPMAWTLPRRKTPWAASLLLAVGACSFLPLGQVAVVGSAASMTTLVVFAAVALALIGARRRGDRAPFHVPGQIAGVPVVAVLALLAIGALATQFEPLVYAITGGVIAAALGAYGAARWIGPTALKESLA